MGCAVVSTTDTTTDTTTNPKNIARDFGNKDHPCTPVGKLGGDCSSDSDCSAWDGDDDRGAGYDAEPNEIQGKCGTYASDYFDLIAAAREDGQYPHPFPVKYWPVHQNQCCGACMGDQVTLHQYLGLFGWFVAACYGITTLIEVGILLIRLISNCKRYSITDAFKDLAVNKLNVDDPDKWFIDASLLSLFLRLLFGGFMVPLTGMDLTSGCAQSNVFFIPTTTLILLFLVQFDCPRAPSFLPSDRCRQNNRSIGFGIKVDSPHSANGTFRDITELQNGHPPINILTTDLITLALW